MEAQGTWTSVDSAVTVVGRAFCFTGRGRVSRAEMGRMVISNGGRVHPRVTRHTDYLVMGSRGSKRWRQPYCGSKTAAALRLIAAGELASWRRKRSGGRWGEGKCHNIPAANGNIRDI